jgi:hypothetical protein
MFSKTNFGCGQGQQKWPDLSQGKVKDHGELCPRTVQSKNYLFLVYNAINIVKLRFSEEAASIFKILQSA